MTTTMEIVFFFFFQAEDGIRDVAVTGVQTCALPISAVSLAADVRRRGLHRDAGTLRETGRDREELQGDRRGQARRPPRAGVLHGGRHRRGDGEGQEAARGGVVADRLRLEIVTPTRLVVAETVDEVVVPGSDGYFGVLPGHAAFLTTLGTGEVIYRIDRDEFYLAVSGGFAEVRNDKVIVLADAAERPEEIGKRRVGKEGRSRGSPDH